MKSLTLILLGVSAVALAYYVYTTYVAPDDGSDASKTGLTLHTMQGCGWCDKQKETLQKMNVKMNITQSPCAGCPGYPCFVCGNNRHAGYLDANGVRSVAMKLCQ